MMNSPLGTYSEDSRNFNQHILHDAMHLKFELLSLFSNQSVTKHDSGRLWCCHPISALYFCITTGTRICFPRNMDIHVYSAWKGKRILQRYNSNQIKAHAKRREQMTLPKHLWISERSICANEKVRKQEVKEKKKVYPEQYFNLQALLCAIKPYFDANKMAKRSILHNHGWASAHASPRSLQKAVRMQSFISLLISEIQKRERDGPRIWENGVATSILFWTQQIAYMSGAKRIYDVGCQSWFILSSEARTRERFFLSTGVEGIVQGKDFCFDDMTFLFIAVFIDRATGCLVEPKPTTVYKMC